MAAITLKPRQLFILCVIAFAFISLTFLRPYTFSRSSDIPKPSYDNVYPNTDVNLEQDNLPAQPSSSPVDTSFSLEEQKPDAAAASSGLDPPLSPSPLEETPTPEKTPRPIYKTLPEKVPSKPIGENFPQAAAAKSPRDLPSIPSWNVPPKTHVPEKTPLFIGFTRNWPLLQQAVVGYITAGWPPSDIYVIENTGVMDANKRGKLSLQNPWYLDHHRLAKIYGVNVIVAPVYLSFAQLQNFYLHTAIDNDWPYYFWSHMDVLAQSHEELEPYRSLYLRAVDTIRETEEKYGNDKWALRFFAYDWLTLVNTKTQVAMGGWDSMISYYGTDCDFYSRMRMLGLTSDIADAGWIYDMGESLDDLSILYRKQQAGHQSSETTTTSSSRRWWDEKPGALPEDSRNSSTYHELQDKLKAMMENKVHGADPRNSWQTRQSGGQGEPYYRSTEGFEEALEITIKAGERVYQAKWGQKRCDLEGANLHVEDAWRVEKDFEGPGSIVP